MLKIIISILMVLLMTGCAGTPVKKTNMLRYDGIYRAEDIETKLGTAYDYLRFYQDGNVISATLIGSAEEFWMVTMRAYKYSSIGKYNLRGDRLIFQTKSENIIVKYRGILEANGDLKLQSHSLSTNHKARANYEFIKVNVENLPDWTRVHTIKPLRDGGVQLEEVPVVPNR